MFPIFYLLKKDYRAEAFEVKASKVKGSQMDISLNYGFLVDF